MPDQTFCTQCGQANPIEAKFCLRCGEPLFQHEEVRQGPPAFAVPPVPVGVVPDFIALRCSHCGGELKIAADVRQLTCLNCGTTQDVVMENGGPVLKPLLKQLEQIEGVLEQENIHRQAARLVTETARFQTDSSNIKAIAEQERQKRMQEVLLLEQRIRENEEGIKQTGCSENDVRMGLFLLIGFVTIGGIGELVLNNQDVLPYGISPFTLVLMSFMGFVSFIICLVNSGSAKSREGSRLRKEVEEMRRRVQQLKY